MHISTNTIIYQFGRLFFIQFSKQNHFIRSDWIDKHKWRISSFINKLKIDTFYRLGESIQRDELLTITIYTRALAGPFLINNNSNNQKNCEHQIRFSRKYALIFPSILLSIKWPLLLYCVRTVLRYTCI